VIGVMPFGFTFPFGSVNPVVWTPVVLGNSDAVRTRHEAPTYSTIARLKAGLKLAAVDAELKNIQSHVSQFYTDPDERAEVASIQVQRYADSLVATNMSEALLVLFGAAAVLWLITCVNATSLLLAHSTVRHREIAIRAALGANRRQIVQQFLVEGLILSAAASLVGLGLAILILRLFGYVLATQFNIHTPLTPNASVVLVLLALTLVTALAFSVWPAVSASRASVESALRTGNTGTSPGRTQLRTRSFLAVSEVGLSLTLLIGCGLLLRTLYALRHVPLGFRTDHVIVANMTIPAYKFTGRDIRTELYQPLLERVQRLPGVQSASLMTEVPLGKTFQMEFTFAAEGNTEADVRQRNLRAQFRAVSPEMQRVFGFRMLEGRFFNEHDTSSSQPAVVVNRAFVKAFLGDDSNPGKFLGQPLISYDGNRQAMVIGVLDDERQVSVAEQSQPEIEVFIPQITPDSAFYETAEGLAMDLAVRTDRTPSSIFPELRRLMREASQELATSKLSTMDQIVADSYSQHLAARLLEIFSGRALLLSLAGIYGLLAYLVAQRTREVALRFALGAQRHDVMWIILRQAGWLLFSGSVLGLTLL
jgi:predicted permease